MKNSELVLFFLSIFSTVLSFILSGIAYYLYRKNLNLHIYNEQLFLELVKLRKKWYPLIKGGYDGSKRTNWFYISVWSRGCLFIVSNVFSEYHYERTN